MMFFYTLIVNYLEANSRGIYRKKVLDFRGKPRGIKPFGGANKHTLLYGNFIHHCIITPYSSVG